MSSNCLFNAAIRCFGGILLNSSLVIALLSSWLLSSISLDGYYGTDGSKHSCICGKPDTTGSSCREFVAINYDIFNTLSASIPEENHLFQCSACFNYGLARIRLESLVSITEMQLYETFFPSIH